MTVAKSMSIVLLGACIASVAVAQTPAPTQSAPIENIRYDIAFDRAWAALRRVQLTMTFDVSGTEPVLLSLPVWTPGAYEVSDFARNILEFDASSRGAAIDWDKVDHDTWRVQPAGTGPVTVTTVLVADSLDNAMAWTAPDLLLLNGTYAFFHPEGRGFDFGADVTVRTEPDWQVATGMPRAPAGAGTAHAFRDDSYHDLVDMPFFIGAFDLDSAQAGGRWQRLASYPAGTMDGPRRSLLLDAIGKMIAVQEAVFGETPFQDYTTMLLFHEDMGGGSALEHQNSHVGIYDPAYLGSPVLPLITAHEIFHAWNVKRMRPAELVPYRYDRVQTTPWLWVSEGLTDYYADLTLVRAGLYPGDLFYLLTTTKLNEVDAAPAVALEDASVSSWIAPRDGSQFLYYSKGSLAGFMLDIIIRDATDNRRSLDHVMRDVYERTWKQNRGFGHEDWWGAAGRAIESGGGDAAALTARFREFETRYIDGREPYPWDTLLPLAGMRILADSANVPRLGVQTVDGADGVTVVEVVPGSAASAAGVRPGDVIVDVGSITVSDGTFGEPFRARYATATEGAPLPITVRRAGESVVLQAQLRFALEVTRAIQSDPAAGERAARIRNGILMGTTGDARR
jgi:predicted metalloprotease with PDZ domain